MPKKSAATTPVAQSKPDAVAEAIAKRSKLRVYWVRSATNPRIGFPPLIRRSPTAFHLYKRSLRNKEITCPPGMTPPKFFGYYMQTSSKMWKALPEKQRAPFIAEAAKLKAKYNEECAEYIRKNPGAPTRVLCLKPGMVFKRGGKSRVIKDMCYYSAIPAPVRPMQPLICYSLMHRDRYPNLTQQERAAALGTDFNNASAEERAVIAAKCDEDRVRYAAEMEKFKSACEAYRTANAADTNVKPIAKARKPAAKESKESKPATPAAPATAPAKRKPAAKKAVSA